MEFDPQIIDKRVQELVARAEELEVMRDELFEVEQRRAELMTALGKKPDEVRPPYKMSKQAAAEAKSRNERQKNETLEQVDLFDLKQGQGITATVERFIDLDQAGGFNELHTYSLYKTELGFLFETQYEVTDDYTNSRRHCRNKNSAVWLFDRSLESPLLADGKRLGQIRNQTTGMVDVQAFQLGSWTGLDNDFFRANEKFFTDILAYQALELLAGAEMVPSKNAYSEELFQRTSFTDEIGAQWTLIAVYYEGDIQAHTVAIRQELDDKPLSYSELRIKQGEFYCSGTGRSYSLKPSEMIEMFTRDLLMVKRLAAQ